MRISKTNKIILILGVFFILFTVFTAFYLKPKEKEVIQAKEIEFVRDYRVEQGRLVSQESGFSLQIPQGWEIRNYGQGVSLANFKEIEIKKDKDLLEQAEQAGLCFINIEIKKFKNLEAVKGLSSLMAEVESGKRQNGIDYTYSLINVSGRDFLRTEFNKEQKIIGAKAETFVQNTTYSVSSSLILCEECLESFNQTLQTVKIDYNK